MHKMRPSFTTMGFLFMTRQASIKGAECTAHSVRPFFRWARLGLPVASACLLAACGGGDSVDPAPPPVADGFTLGGTAGGLGSGKRVVLQNNGGDDLGISANGGFTFAQLNPVGPREGEAKSVEARVNLKELGWTEQDWSAGAWWRDVGAGYSISRYDNGLDITETGAEVLGQFTPNIGLYARFSKAERGDEALTQAQITGGGRISENRTLSAEVRRVRPWRNVRRCWRWAAACIPLPTGR